MRHTYARYAIVLALATLASCKSIVLDPSISAIQAGDYTLALSGCSAHPGQGADTCRVKIGEPVSAEWAVIVPFGDFFETGELLIRYKDIEKTYAITSKVVKGAWRDIIDHEVWQSTDSGIALLLAELRFRDPQGVVRLVQARGILFLVPTSTVYEVMPIDSGFAGFKTICKVQYSTAGRSAIECK